MVAVFTSAAVSAIGAQGSTGPDVCALVDAAAVARITGRTPPPGTRPEATDPSAFRSGERGCSFLDVQYVVFPVTPGSFARKRGLFELAGQPFKTQTVSGLGDEAYLLWGTGRVNASVTVMLRSGNTHVGIENLTSADSVEVMKKALLSIARTVVPRIKE
jgi:hypothetical protein